MTFHVSAASYFSPCLPALEGRISEALEERRKLSLGIPDRFDVRLRYLSDENSAAPYLTSMTLANAGGSWTDERTLDFFPSAKKEWPHITLFAIAALSDTDEEGIVDACGRIKQFIHETYLLDGNREGEFLETILNQGARAFEKLDWRAQAWRAGRGNTDASNYDQRKGKVLAMLPGVRKDLRTLAKFITYQLSTPSDPLCLRHELDHLDLRSSPANASVGGDPRWIWALEARALCIEFTEGRGMYARMAAADRMRRALMRDYILPAVGEESEMRRMDPFDSRPLVEQRIVRAGRRAAKSTARAYIHQPSLLKRAAQYATTFNEYCKICEGKA